MKARVIETGEIVDVEKTILRGGECYINITGEKIGSIYMKYELDFGFDCDYDPDYWARLEHQYAGMAMQAYIIASHISQFSFCEGDMKDCKSMAHALVEKMKEERK